jgi:hypothetical protein
MTSPLTATLARALYQDSTGPGFDREPPKVREDWYRYAERVLGTEDGKRVAELEAAARMASAMTPSIQRDGIDRLRAALDALREPSDDAGAAA